MPSYRFGKLPPKVDYRTLRFKNYLTAALAPPPASYNVLTNIYAKLNVSDPTQLFPMDGNDTLGDCTIAALALANDEVAEAHALALDNAALRIVKAGSLHQCEVFRKQIAEPVLLQLRHHLERHRDFAALHLRDLCGDEE